MPLLLVFVETVFVETVSIGFVGVAILNTGLGGKEFILNGEVSCILLLYKWASVVLKIFVILFKTFIICLLWLA